MNMFLLENGETSDIRQVSPENYELNEDEPLWSSSSEGDADEDDFEAINMINDSSMERLELERHKTSTL